MTTGRMNPLDLGAEAREMAEEESLFHVERVESLDDYEEGCVTDDQLVLWADAADRDRYTMYNVSRSPPPSLPASTTITPVPSSLCIYSVKVPFSSESDVGTDIFSACRICHLPGDEQDPIFSPCRCSGTLQYIHYTCLLKWIQISSKKSRKPPRCELCHYQFHRHKKFRFHSWKLPKVNRRDKCLHTIFILNLLIMISCAVATVMCFLSDKGQITKFPKNRAALTTEEIITLSCGVLFFVSFFIAMSVEIKAKHTVYKLVVKFLMQNMEWEIEEYDRKKDKLYSRAEEFV